MAQYETVNGIPKLKMPKGAAGSTTQSKGRYLDKDGQIKDVADLPDYLELVKRLGENGYDATDDLAKLSGMGIPMSPPVRKRMNVWVAAAYPYISYHARYMRELTEIASQFLINRIMRQKDLMRGIQSYKEHVDHVTEDRHEHQRNSDGSTTTVTVRS